MITSLSAPFPRLYTLPNTLRIYTLVTYTLTHPQAHLPIPFLTPFLFPFATPNILLF